VSSGPATLARRFDRALDWVLRDRAVIPFLAVIYLLVGAVFIVTDYTLNDEGLQTRNGSVFIQQHFLGAFFVQKTKPVLAVLYMPFAGHGLHAFLAVHLAVSALAVPLIGAVARSLGMTLPNFPALVLAFSPVFQLCAPAGITNADGVVGVCLVLYLLIVKRASWGAGLVLGTLPWVRHELSLLAAFLVFRAIFVERDWRFVVATAVFPLAYGVSGAFYYHDVLWLMHYPPQVPFPGPNQPGWWKFSLAWLVTAIIAALISLSPVTLVALAVPRQRLTGIEQWLLAVAAVWILFPIVLAPVRLFNFTIIPRHLLVVLPEVALLTGRVAEAWREGERLRTPMVVSIVGFAALWAVSGFSYARAVVPLLALILLAARAAAWQQRFASVALLATAALAGPLVHPPAGLARPDLSPELPAIVEWLRAHPEAAAHPLFTNVPLLAGFLDSSGDHATRDIRFLCGPDMLWDISHMTSESTGQRKEVFEILRNTRFEQERWAFPDEMTLDAVPDGSLFVTRKRDNRTEMLLPAALWGPHLVPLVPGNVEISRFVRHPSG
jgi:hypothetical protein